MYENFKKFTMLEDQPTTASDSTGNTDGEDTQKVSLGELLLNAGTRIVDLEKQSNDQVEIIMHLEKQLASLREQLATEQDMRSTAEFANRMIIKDLNEKLKQKEDENRELKEQN